jgi:putrescine transport system ATP-binding protein
VPSGQSLAVLGSAGAGKSCLLRLVAGFIKPAAGRVLFNGHDLAGLPPQRRPFVLLTARDTLFPHMNVARNVAYGLRALGLERSAAERRVEAALEHAGVPMLASAAPEQLNRAQRQKVALARALAIEPLVLLLDDPLDAVDPVDATQVLLSLRELQRRVGLTLILATGNGEMSMAFGDRIATMERGRLLQDGAPADLYRHPHHAATARLTGPVNLILAGSGRTGTALALRPDAIELHLQAPAGSDALEGRVARIAYGASGLTAHVTLERLGETVMAKVDTRRLDSADLPEGRRVWCTWDRESACTVRL